MERRKIGTIITVASAFEDYSYMLNGIAGIGKTTTGVDIGQMLFGIEGVLLLTVGEEPKPEHMGNIFGDVAPTWEDFESMIKTIIKYKKEDYPNLKMMVIDSSNEVFRLAEDYVVRLNNNENPTKKVKSVKSAFGGFQAGENMVVDLVIKTIFPLKAAGVCPFIIGHTKKKNVKDQQSDIEFEVTTSDLDAKYYNAIKDRVSVVGCAYMEREMNNIETVKDAFTKKNKQVGRIKSERRVLSFRDEEFAIDNKSHLKFIEPKVDFTATGFVNAIQNAIKKQIDYYNLPITERLKMDAELQEGTEVKKDEVIDNTDPLDYVLDEIEPTVKIEDSIKKDMTVDADKNEELKAEITAILIELGKKKDKTKLPLVNKILAEYGAGKITETDKPTEMFAKILECIK